MAFDLDDDNYKIIKPIGKGGMSTVYLAKDKNLDRLVAIKLLHPTISDNEKNRERLKIEALAIARINHENIVNVYNFVNKDEYNYIVMEYIDGDTLSDFIEKNPTNNPELSLAIFLKILEGINYSHQQNIIHRDIKPENIMISNTGKIKIMDFGIASIIGEVHNLTTTGSIMGSPMFMSPEHLTDEKIDKQSDIFSLGIILYWMLTKTFPFNGKNTAQLLNNILKCQYENPQQLNSLISNEIKIIIKKILQKSKLARYKESDTIIKDIQEYFKNLNYDYETELEIYFNNPNAYHKRFIKEIPQKYINYSKKLYKEKLYSKAVSYSYLTLEYDSENLEAKLIIKKIERGSLFKKYIPISIILLSIIVISLVFINMNIEKKTNINSHKNIPKISIKNNNINYKQIYQDYKTAIKLGKDIFYGVSRGKDIFYGVSRGKDTLYSVLKAKDTIKAILPINKNNIKKISSNKKIKKIKKIITEDIEIETRISPKAASVYIDDKFYGYGNINNIKLKTNRKYDLKVTSNACYSYKRTILYKDKKNTPITIRLKWKPAKLKLINASKGDIFINNNYKGNYKEYNYEINPSPISNGNEKINLKIVKDGKIIFKNDIILKAGQTTTKNFKKL